MGLHDHGQRIADHVEISQAQEVELEQTQILYGTHFVLGHHRGVGRVLSGLGLALNRQVFGQWFVGNYHCGGMNAVAAAQTFEAECHVDNFTGLGICCMQLA